MKKFSKKSQKKRIDTATARTGITCLENSRRAAADHRSGSSPNKPTSSAYLSYPCLGKKLTFHIRQGQGSARRHRLRAGYKAPPFGRSAPPLSVWATPFGYTSACWSPCQPPIPMR